MKNNTNISTSNSINNLVKRAFLNNSSTSINPTPREKILIRKNLSIICKGAKA